MSSFFLWFHEFLDESIADEIRQDLEDVLFRMKPWQHESNGSCVFGGWARMALTIDQFTIVEVYCSLNPSYRNSSHSQVAKPLVGEKSPAVVRADLQLNIGKRHDIKAEVSGLHQLLGSKTYF